MYIPIAYLEAMFAGSLTLILENLVLHILLYQVLSWYLGFKWIGGTFVALEIVMSDSEWVFW